MAFPFSGRLPHAAQLVPSAAFATKQSYPLSLWASADLQFRLSEQLLEFGRADPRSHFHAMPGLLSPGLPPFCILSVAVAHEVVGHMHFYLVEVRQRVSL